MSIDVRRGATRSEPARVAILQATATLFAKHGYEQLTIEGIAAEAKVGKQTIYRWWPTKSALVADCLAEGLLLPDGITPPNTGDFTADITAWLRTIVGFVGQPGNDALLRSLVIAGAANEDVAVRFNEKLGIVELLTERAADGPGATVEFAEALLGAVVLRVLRNGPLDEEFVQNLVATLT